MLTIYHDRYFFNIEQCLKKIESEMIIQPTVLNHF